MKNWKAIWNNRTCSKSSELILQKLIYLDGFDSGAGIIDVEKWLQYIESLISEINIDKNYSIYDIGCGSGAFLYPFYQAGHEVGGIDFSECLLKKALEVMENMDFQVKEAIEVNTEVKYDLVVSNSVFQYFPHINYAEEVVLKMINKSRRFVMVLDIPDSIKKIESETFRRGSLSVGEYENKYRELNHLYYDKDWFKNLAEKNSCTVNIFDQKIEAYGNSNFRFNVMIEKLMA